tara:strand:- start:179018 stop:181009 length:1992 start_codon:yes stop_codon:yes gene_type:complete
MSLSLRRKHTTSIDLETLEDRRMLAAFGNSWPDARDLSISFPSDGVEVGTYENDIESTLDQVAQRQQWQELALRAYQTWAINADVNVGLRNDYDVKFGTPGLTTNDPRFGEFRIGAFPQEGLLASSVPFQPIAGTYSGDLLLNSNEQFKYHDWSGGVGPDPATLTENERDLFSLLLHEAGNTLGIADNQLEWSVMFGQYAGPKGSLAAEDVAEIQALYGARSDPYELVDNGQIQTATMLTTPVGFDPLVAVIRSRGSLVNGTDVDTYKVTPVAGQDSVTIRLRAAGVSLLMSKLQVIDESGQILAETSAQSVFDNDNQIQIDGLQSHNSLYVRVAAADAADVYAVGDYVLEVDYRPPAIQATDIAPGDYDSGAESLFANFDLLDTEVNANDSVASAQELAFNSFGESRTYELESSVSSASDLDYWKITAPDTVEGRLVVQVAGVGADQPDVRIDVVDATGVSLGTAGKLHADGTFTLEVAQPTAGQEYFIRVSVDPSSTVGVGNYVAVAEFQASSAQMNHLISDTVSESADDFIRWTASETKLFRFDLNADGTAPDQAVRLTIYDAHTKEIEMIAVARSGITRSALAWLQQGEYILQFTAIGGSQQPTDDISYSLYLDGISDDQDDDGDGDGGDDDPYYYDPSGGGSYYDPYYYYYYYYYYGY